MSVSTIARFVITAAIVAAPTVGTAEARSQQLAANTASQNTVSSSASQAAPAAPQTAVAPKLVCKRLESSYSRAGKRVCLTEKAWQQVEADAQ